MVCAFFFITFSIPTGVTKALEDFASTLLLFQSDFDLQPGVSEMRLNQVPINDFLTVDYSQVFGETPPSTVDTIGTKKACPG